MRWLLAWLTCAHAVACAPLPPAAPGVATPTRADAIATVDPRPLAADPAHFTGQPVTLFGKPAAVEQHGDATWVRLLAQVPERPGLTETVIVTMTPRREDVLRGECYLIAGVGTGTMDTLAARWGVAPRTPSVRADIVRPGAMC